MRILVINLARATDRRQKMTEQLESLGLPFEFLEATDGRCLTEADRALVDHERRKSISPYPLSDNETGCWISHRRAMENLLASNDSMLTIVEDDSILFPSFPRILEAIEQKAGSFDVIDLHRNFKNGEIFAYSRPLLAGYNLGRIGYTHMNLTAYVISREGARKFLASAPRFAHAVDKELHRYWVNGLDLYGLEKPVAMQDDGGFSYINETRGQGASKDRVRYPDADSLIWRLRRRLTKLSDTIRKRLAFPAYARSGKRK